MPINPIDPINDEKKLSELFQKLAEMTQQREKNKYLTNIDWATSECSGYGTSRAYVGYSPNWTYNITNEDKPTEDPKKSDTIPNRQRRKEFAGVLIYRKVNEDLEILLMRTDDGDGQFWSIPKGEYFADEENSAEAAIREVKKQTDIQIDIINVKYLCAADLPKNRKQVFAFISNWNGDEPKKDTNVSFLQLDVAYNLIHPSQKIFIRHLRHVLGI